MGAAPWPPMYELPSGLRQPAHGTDTPSTPADGGVSDPGQMSAGVLGAPADSPAPLCPNCLTDLDPDGYCDGCSYLATVKRPA